MTEKDNMFIKLIATRAACLSAFLVVGLVAAMQEMWATSIFNICLAIFWLFRLHRTEPV